MTGKTISVPIDQNGYPLRQHSCTLHSIMPFGIHRGTMVGFIYLYDPGYIDWLLRGTDSFCLLDIDTVVEMKCKHTMSTEMSVMLKDMGRGEAIGDYIRNNFSFQEIQYHGFESYKFSDEAISRNLSKISRFGLSKQPKKFIDVANQRFFLEILPKKILEALSDRRFKYNGYGTTSKGSHFLDLQFDNSGAEVVELPKTSGCKLGLIQPFDKSYEMHQLLNFRFDKVENILCIE